jgi:hypothetical protein
LVRRADTLFVVFLGWSLLGWHARGMILAAYGVALLLVLLLPALRTRERLKSGVQTQGTVVGAEERTGHDGDTYYHRHCCVRCDRPGAARLSA